MQIIDEKSLIKKYQNEIRCLKQELEQLKRGIVTVVPQKDSGENDIFLLKQKVGHHCILLHHMYGNFPFAYKVTSELDEPVHFETLHDVQCIHFVVSILTCYTNDTS